jgi:hypothetical protein
MRRLATTFRRILDLRMCMALSTQSVICLRMFGGLSAYFVGVSEPSGPFLFAAHESNPLVTASAQTFPHVGIPIHASGLLRLLKGAARRSTDTVCETLVVPESAVLQDEPSSWLANSTPTFALIPVTSDPTWRVEITVKAKLLLVWDEIWVARVHVFWWRWNLVLVERSVKIRRIAKISVV